MRTNDTPKNKPRVRMRVESKVRKTSLPLAHDEVYDGGSNTIPMGVSEQVVYAEDVPAVMAKVERDTAGLEMAHSSFWATATQRTREGLQRAGIHTPEATALPIPDEVDVHLSPNRWVETHWPERAQAHFFNWLTQEANAEERSPISIFTALRRRPPLPLRSAEVLPDTEMKPPLSNEDKTTSTIVGALGAELAAGLRGAMGAPSPAVTAENEALKAQVAALTQRLDSLAASLGEKPARK